MSKKILLFVYSRLNLGDNLFVYVLSKKYPNIEFYLHATDEEYKIAFKSLSNVKIIEQDRFVDNVDIDFFDGYIYIGGSIFIESEYSFGELTEFQKFIKKCNEKNKKFYYMSCNFGPYQTKDYFNLAKKNFELCDGICFRDKESYKLFKDIEKVHYGPDAIFNMDVSKTKKEKKSIGISIIDLSIRKELKDKQKEYEDFIKRIIKKFAKRGYKVYLFSFCEFEQDEIEMQRIVEQIPKDYRDKLQIVKYKNNIEEFLGIYSKMKYMVATRFHSMILSVIYGQKVYNLTYSKKHDNVIEDLKLFKKYQSINDLTFETVMRKYEFKKVSRNKISKIQLLSKKQFEYLDMMK